MLHYSSDYCAIVDLPVQEDQVSLSSLLLSLSLFYYRLFHHRALYSRIHKIHHEWTAPVSIAAMYCHPLEHFFVNLLSIMSGPIILGSYFNNHLASVWLWVSMAIINTTYTHSGYHLPFVSSNEGHDFHHSKSVYTCTMIYMYMYHVSQCQLCIMCHV